MAMFQCMNPTRVDPIILTVAQLQKIASFGVYIFSFFSTGFLNLRPSATTTRGKKAEETSSRASANVFLTVYILVFDFEHKAVRT